MGQLMDEHSGVLAKHRDIGHFLDHHHRRCQAPGQLALVSKCACRRIHIDHRHSSSPLVIGVPYSPAKARNPEY